MKWLILMNLVVAVWPLENPPPPQPVLKFKFEVNPKNSSRLLGELIDSERYATYNLTTPASQLLVNTNIHELTWDQWVGARKRSKLNFTNIDVEKLKEISKTLHLNTSVEYFKFLELVKDPFNQMKQAMEAINVQDTSLISYTMFVDKVGNESFFDLFRNANFTNWPEAQKILNLTDKEIFDFGKGCVLRYLGNVSLLDFGRMVKNLTGEVKNYHVGYEHDQEGLIKSIFDVLEVYPEGDFKVMIEKYNETIVSPNILATRTGIGRYLSSGVIYDDVTRMAALYTKPFLLENQNKFEIKVLNFNGTLVDLVTNDNVSFTKQDGLVNQLQRCYYVPDTNRSLLVSVTDGANQMVINKASNIEFVMGAPLFCDGQLVGVTLTETISSIVFAKVPFRMAVHSTTPPLHTTPKPIEVTSDLIATVNFNVNESKIPELIAYLLLDSAAGNDSRTNPLGVTSSDVIQSYKLEKVDYQEFAAITPPSSPSIEDVRDVLHLMQTFNASVISTYRQLTSALTDTQKNALFNTLDINYKDLQRLLLYYPTNELKFVEFLLGGNLSKKNIEAAIKQANLSVEAIYNVIKPTFLHALHQSPMSASLRLIDIYGGYDALKKHMSRQGITSKTFQSNEGYQNILRNFVGVLRNSTAEAPIVSRRNVITSNEVYDNYNDPATREFVTIEVRTSHTISDIVKIVPYSSGYSNLTLETLFPSSQTVLPIGKSSEPKQCKLLTVEGVYDVAQVYNHKTGFEILVDTHITRDKYKPGAGLVCQGHLYGVATRLINLGDAERIQFAGFKNVKPVVEDTPTGFAPSFGHNLFLVGACLILTFVVFH